MGLPLDRITALYQELEVITEAKDKGIITANEKSTLIAERKNEIHNLLIPEIP